MKIGLGLAANQLPQNLKNDCIQLFLTVLNWRLFIKNLCKHQQLQEKNISVEFPAS